MLQNCVRFSRAWLRIFVLGALISCGSPLEPHSSTFADLGAPAAQKPAFLVAFGDECWTNVAISCYDGTSAGGILNGSEYGSLGGFAPTYSGQQGSDGSGFGDWDANSYSCRQITAALCVHARAGFGSQYQNCPHLFAFNSIDPNTGNMELWNFTLNQTRYRYGIQTGKYSGSYSSAGTTYNTATAEIFCQVGMMFATVSHPNL